MTFIGQNLRNKFNEPVFLHIRFRPAFRTCDFQTWPLIRNKPFLVRNLQTIANVAESVQNSPRNRTGSREHEFPIPGIQETVVLPVPAERGGEHGSLQLPRIQAFHPGTTVSAATSRHLKSNYDPEPYYCSVGISTP